LAWTIEYSDTARKQLKKLDKSIADLITRFMRDKIGSARTPRSMGHSLVGELRGYWRYRIGDFRIVTEIKDDKLVVLVIAIGHRKEIYR
jgi:mRNA interferase RelE/StbE